VDLFEAGYELDDCWIVGIDVVSRLWHLNIRVSCAIDVLGDFSANNSVGRLYRDRIKIAWTERELCRLLPVKKDTFLLKLSLKIISYSFLVQFWVCLLKLIVILENAVALDSFCLRFAFFKQFSSLNEAFTFLNNFFTYKFLNALLFGRE